MFSKLKSFIERIIINTNEKGNIHIGNTFLLNIKVYKIKNCKYPITKPLEPITNQQKQFKTKIRNILNLFLIE